MIIKPHTAITMSSNANAYNEEVKNNAIKRQTAHVKRVLAEYKLASDAFGGGHLPSWCVEIDDWYQSSKDAFLGIVNWVTVHGTEKQKEYVHWEMCDFDKQWIISESGEGYWADI